MEYILWSLLTVASSLILLRPRAGVEGEVKICIVEEELWRGYWVTDGARGLTSCVSFWHRAETRTHRGWLEGTGLGSVYQPARAETLSVKMSTETEGLGEYSPVPARSDNRSFPLRLSSASSFAKAVQGIQESFHFHHLYSTYCLHVQYWNICTFSFFFTLGCDAHLEIVARDQRIIWDSLATFKRGLDADQPVQCVSEVKDHAAVWHHIEEKYFLSKTYKHTPLECEGGLQFLFFFVTILIYIIKKKYIYCTWTWQKTTLQPLHGWKQNSTQTFRLNYFINVN